jgi:sulfate adenylyltransferase
MPKPHGGRLIDRTFKEDQRKEAAKQASSFPNLRVSADIVQEVENIGHGVFSPLEGFMYQDDYQSVLDNRRLSNDLPWTMPIVFDQDAEDLRTLGVKEGAPAALVDERDDRIIAVLHVEQIYDYSKDEFAHKVYGTKDTDHPGVAKVMAMKNSLIGGRIDLISDTPSPYDSYALNPIETRVLFKEKGWRTVVGFQTRNPPHLGHEYVQKAALTFVDGLFINPVIGKKKVGDFTDDVILSTYDELIKHYYLKDRAVMSILKFQMRYGGPREAIFHAIVRKNFGCTHFIIGRDHAGVGNYYPPFAAQEIFDEFPDLGITPLFFRSFFFCTKCGGPVNEKICPHQDDKEVTISFSGTKIRTLLKDGKRPDASLMRPEIADMILKSGTPFVE